MFHQESFRFLISFWTSVCYPYSDIKPTTLDQICYRHYDVTVPVYSFWIPLVALFHLSTYFVFKERYRQLQRLVRCQGFVNFMILTLLLSLLSLNLIATYLWKTTQMVYWIINYLRSKRVNTVRTSIELARADNAAAAIASSTEPGQNIYGSTLVV